MGPGGAPNRPLPPTPDEEESGDRTLVLRRVSYILLYRLMYTSITLFTNLVNVKLCAV